MGLLRSAPATQLAQNQGDPCWTLQIRRRDRIWQQPCRHPHPGLIHPPGHPLSLLPTFPRPRMPPHQVAEIITIGRFSASITHWLPVVNYLMALSQNNHCPGSVQATSTARALNRAAHFCTFCLSWKILTKFLFKSNFHYPRIRHKLYKREGSSALQLQFTQSSSPHSESISRCAL